MLRITLEAGYFDQGRRTFVGPGGECPLTRNEARLLVYLAERPDQTVSQRELLQAVWGYADRVESRTVYTTIARLQAKVERDPGRSGPSPAFPKGLSLRQQASRVVTVLAFPAAVIGQFVVIGQFLVIDRRAAVPYGEVPKAELTVTP